MKRTVLMLGAIAGLTTGCSSAPIDWTRTGQSVFQGACNRSSRCESPCDVPELVKPQCENRAPGSLGAQRL